VVTVVLDIISVVCACVVCVSAGVSLPYRLRFGVKFYAADPCKLFEEITRCVVDKNFLKQARKICSP